MTFAKFKALSDISRDAAQVFFASVFVGPMISGDLSVNVIAAGFAL